VPEGNVPEPQQRKRIRAFMHRREGASRFSFEIDRTALKDVALIVVPALIVIVAAFWFASRFIRPAPPDTFIMSTGAEGGAYHVFAQRYRDILARDGVRVELRASLGSVENLQRLADPSSGVEAALVQSGVQLPDSKSGLVSLGSAYYEPLWIFYRHRREITLLNDLRGKRIAVGPEGSGTRALALQLLQAVGADEKNTVVEAAGGNAAADALIQAKVDVAFFVASPDAPVVQRLVKAEGVRVLSLANADAFARRFPFLTALTLPRGVIDLAAQLPAQDLTLLAATATILVREDFHPALAFLLLNAMNEVHHAPGVMQRLGEFPAARETEFPLSDEAQRYYKSGTPFLRRYLPFWLVNLLERMLVLLVPVFAVLVPVFKILPALLQWRIKSRVFRWYGEIKYLEDDLMRAPDPARVPEILERLDEIERGVDHTRVPMAHADYIYNLRTHLDVVRNRILRLSAAARERSDTRTAQTPAGDRG
jgi:TRAP transporter TAXI family solute receptor